MSTTKDILTAVSEKRGLPLKEVELIYESFIEALVEDAQLPDSYSYGMIGLGNFDKSYWQTRANRMNYKAKTKERKALTEKAMDLKRHDSVRTIARRPHMNSAIETRMLRELHNEGYLLEINIKDARDKRNRDRIIRKTEELQNGE